MAKLEDNRGAFALDVLSTYSAGIILTLIISAYAAIVGAFDVQAVYRDTLTLISQLDNAGVVGDASYCGVANVPSSQPSAHPGFAHYVDVVKPDVLFMDCVGGSPPVRTLDAIVSDHL